MDFAERAAIYFAGRADMHRRRAAECEAVAPAGAASLRRMADTLDEVVEYIRENEGALRRAGRR